MMRKLKTPMSVLMMLALCGFFTGCNRSTTAQDPVGPASPIIMRNGQGQSQSSAGQSNLTVEGIILPALVGTWVSRNAFIVEFGDGKTIWLLNKNGAYKITVQGKSVSEIGKWRVEGDQFLRYTRRNGKIIRSSEPFTLISDRRSFTYGGSSGGHHYTFTKQQQATKQSLVGRWAYDGEMDKVQGKVHTVTQYKPDGTFTSHSTGPVNLVSHGTYTVDGDTLNTVTTSISSHRRTKIIRGIDDERFRVAGNKLIYLNPDNTDGMFETRVRR